jgi:hypothetical protein
MTASPTGWAVTPPADFRTGAHEPERQSLWVTVIWAREQATYARGREEHHRRQSRKYNRPYRWLALANPIMLAVTGVCLYLAKGEAWGVVVALIAFGASAAEASYRSVVPWLQQRGQSHREMEWAWHQVERDLTAYCDRDARDPMLTHDALKQRVASLEQSISTAVKQERRSVAAAVLPEASSLYSREV